MSKVKRHRTFKFMLKPTGEQERLFVRYAGCCRYVYNLALSLVNDFYGYVPDRGWNCFQYINEMTQVWKPNAPFLKEAPSQTLLQALFDLDRSYKAFWNEGAGYPKFRKRGLNDSFRYPQHFKIDEGNVRVFLPKVGWVRYRKSRNICGTPKQLTVKRELDHWYACIACEEEFEIEMKPELSSPVGADLGVAIFAALSNGTTLEAPLTKYHRLDERIRILQNQLSRKVFGSKRYRKQQDKIRRLQRKLANVRRDFLHKASSYLAKNHSVVVLEDLLIGNMTRSAKGTLEAPGKNVKQKAGLNRSILNQGWYTFRQMLSYKLPGNGGQLILVDPKYTSQSCPRCGHVDKANRKTQKDFVCQNCGHVANADINAAVNILNRGLKAIRAGQARSAREVSPKGASSENPPKLLTDPGQQP